MPPLSGFSDNPFRTREDVVNATLALLRPLTPYFSPGKARIRIPVSTGVHFDEAAAQLEGFVRPLWGIASLLQLETSTTKYGSYDPALTATFREVTEPWIAGLSTGTDPDHPEYWGAISDMDQRMVEAEVISYALLSAPDKLFHSRDEKTRRNITAWLRGLNGKQMPSNNWRWFRIFANLALIKVCRISDTDLEEEMKADFAVLDSFFLEDGWSSDGPWLSTPEEEDDVAAFGRTRRRDTIGKGRQVDYYSGSFAIQFSQLLYAKFAEDMDSGRVSRYRQQARDFGASFWRYFDSDGSAIPFGRSLTYRFSCGAFFSALAVSEVPDMPWPLSTPGQVKGFLLRHLRWWAAHSEDIFHVDGTLNIGWMYPNMYMCEDYNSPQSAYWGLKTLIAISLTKYNDFWTAEEEPYPFSLFPPQLIPAPRQIISNHPAGNHHFCLSPAQFVSWPLKATQAKYSKFEYSSAFGFSVPTGPLIQQIAPDCTLALSRDGAETWAVKWKCSEAVLSTACLHIGADSSSLPIATVRWYPWADRQVEINTTLIPPTDRWPDWHIRIHRIHVRSPLRSLHTVEGGFASLGRRSNGTKIPYIDKVDSNMEIGTSEGILETDSSILILSTAGASGLLRVETEVPFPAPSTNASTLKPDANTNLVHQRTLIPTITRDISRDIQAGEGFTLTTGVFAISSTANDNRRSGRSVAYRWADQPRLVMSNLYSMHRGEDFIILGS